MTTRKLVTKKIHAEPEDIIGEVGDLFFDTDDASFNLRISDGVTPGGVTATSAADESASIRTLESFGAQAVDFNEQPIDNRAAIQAAVDWTSETGGKVMIGRGVYGVDGSIQTKSFTNLQGIDRHHSIIQQMATAPTDVFTSSDGPGESIGRCTFRDFTIHGGWDRLWVNDLSGHNAAGIRLLCNNAGPDDPVLLARLNVGSQADPHHRIINMIITHIQGTGVILTGRGETVMQANYITSCSLIGIDCSAPDNWFALNTVNLCGEMGVNLNAGNQRLVGEKYWFIGMRKDIEASGVGLNMADAGHNQIHASTLTIQDTWGAGIRLSGAAPIISCALDECGGGRVEEQGFGWEGVRATRRSFIEFHSTPRYADVTATVSGGDRNGAANRPYLVDMQSAGAIGNNIKVRTFNADFHPDLIRQSFGIINANRYNEVWQNGALVHGVITPAQLADATHGVNVQDGPQVAYLDNGSIAVRNGATWQVNAGTSTVTPA